MSTRVRVAAALTGLAVLAVGACQTGRVAPAPAPWADRPVVSLGFEVAADLGSVSGHEQVVFTPDLPTCELVFRAWPNKPTTYRSGSSLVTDRVTVDGAPADVEDVAAGAPADAPAGTLLDIPLPGCAEAGQQLTVALDFTLQLGQDADERVGTSTEAEIAWFGTAFPLLAWERGRGWDRDPAVPLNGEMAMSEDFRLASLEVTAPSAYQVLGTGSAAGTEPAAEQGWTVHRFTAPAVRDVTVTVGRLDVAEETVDGTRLHVAAAAGSGTDLAEWTEKLRAAKKSLVDLLGAFPYPDLWVTVVPSQSSGIEYPGAVQFGDVDPAVRFPLLAHELAHMWFYGLVGNDQGRDPWLDESFATFAQMVTAGGSTPAYADIPADRRRDVGRPMAYWTQFRQANRVYYDTVYDLGAATLLAARSRAGADRFDAALHAYLRAGAHRVATPADVATAFADVPDALELLRRVGALPSTGG